MHCAVADTDKGKAVAGFFYSVPVDLSLELRYVDTASDHVIIVTFIAQDTGFIITEVFPVIVVKREIIGEIPHMPVFPCLDVFFLELGGGLVFLFFFFLFCLLVRFLFRGFCWRGAACGGRIGSSLRGLVSCRSILPGLVVFCFCRSVLALR